MNMFGASSQCPGTDGTGMATNPTEYVREKIDVPVEGPFERLDVRELGPPEPLVETLERLEALDEEAILVQVNDRVPQHLYPKLDERGYAYDTVETEEATVTAIWEA